MSEKPVNERFLDWRGRITALSAQSNRLVFVTDHPEGRATALYRLNPETMSLAAEALPAGGLALATADDLAFVSGTEGRLICAGGSAKTPAVLSHTFDPPSPSLAVLADNRLAALSGESVVIVSQNRGDLLQTLTLPDPGTALASDPTGRWLVAGTQKGTVSVFECEEKDEFLLSESAKLHEGAVTALLFEPEELRFLSAGADLKLLLTHARGKLEPEDRGRGGMHEDIVTSIAHGPGERFFTGSRDGTCKNWSRSDRTRPSTQSEGVVSVVGMAVLEIHTRPHLVVAGHDSTLRFFLLDAAGKFGPAVHRLHGALAGARHELSESEPTRQEAALKKLAEWSDAEALALLFERITAENDAGLRRLAVDLLARSTHPQAGKFLEKCLDHGDDVVRQTAYEGLVRLHGPRDFGPIDLALAKNHANIALLAVQSLAAFAKEDDRAHSRLVKALDHSQQEVARAALLSLEEVHGDNAEGDLLGLASVKHDSVRRLAIVRMHQRGFLNQSRALAAVRRQLESKSADIRHAALLALILSRPRLAAALRERDADLHRQLFELETFSLEPAKEGDKKATPPKLGKAKTTPDPDDLEPLLQATSSRALGTSLAGARLLALLQDGRALGLLLQISREEDAAARVEVCRGLADLRDPRSLPRLRSLLFDSAAEVRDAAFSALASVHEDEPFVAVSAGYSSDQEDVHRRALELLVRANRRKPPQDANEPGGELLRLSLNDSFPSVRKEALKATLGMNVGGGESATLEFLRQSAHADVRKDVLTEAMAQFRQPWAWALLLDLFNDPDPSLRADAFEFALKETRRRDLKPMESGLRSKFPDIRKKAIDELRRQHKPAAEELIVSAVHDDDRDVRQAALAAIVSSRSREAVVRSLDSQHADVRLVAAMTLGKFGDPAAFAPLVELTRPPQPEKNDPKLAAWKKSVAQALDGLSDLGDPRAIDIALPFLDNEYPEVRKDAATALAWCAREAHGSLLCERLTHADPMVRCEMALGAAMQGRVEARAFLMSAEFISRLGVGLQLVALATLGPQAETELISLLDHDDASIRRMALLILLMREWKEHDGTPRRLIACLSSLMPRVRLAAAEGLQAFPDAESFAAFVVGQFNDRGEQDAWKIAPETIDAVAETMSFAPRWIRGRAACMLAPLKADKQDEFDAWWGDFHQRFSDEISQLSSAASKRKPTKITATASELADLAFGAFVGLLREQGGAHAKKQQASLGTQPHRVRQTAAARLVAMAEADPNRRAACLPVLIQALGDPIKEVRTAAFESLLKLKLDAPRLAAEAMESGFEDLGVAGLNLLTSGASAAEGRKVLEEAMLSRNDGLALRAAELLRDRADPIKTAAGALTAAYEKLRRQALVWLASSDDEKARAALRGALDSRFKEIRESAAIELSRKKDASAYDALVSLLKAETREAMQARFISALSELGDARGAGALLDRLEQDPTGTARPKLLFQAIGGMRRIEIAERLLKTLDRKEWRGEATAALLRISGFDQPIEDPEEERAEHAWLEKQHPRHDTLLASLMERLLEWGEFSTLATLVPAARWAKSNSVAGPLATLCASPDDALRNAAVEAVGWRLRKRDGSPDPLVKALEHAHPDTRFLAAEQLARAGRNEGLSTLLSAIELVDDVELRERAVEALGILGDARALDVLLRLAGEDAHALQEAAAEAIGHLGQSDKADQIFALLERFARGDSLLALFALRGLRWFNTTAGWQLVRDRLRNGIPLIQQVTVRLLGFNDDPATRDLLLQAIAGQGPFHDFYFHEDALDSARRLFGEESLDPDFALLQMAFASPETDYVRRALDRISARPDAARLFQVLETADDAIRDEVIAILLGLDELPLDAAAAALESPHPGPVLAAARVIGRAGNAKDTRTAKSVEAALESWVARWDAQYEQCDPRLIEYNDDLKLLGRCALSLLWAAGRLGCGRSILLTILAAHIDEVEFRPLRLHVLNALSGMKVNKEVRDALVERLNDPDQEVRQRAASLLAQGDAKKAAEWAAPLVSDRPSFVRVARVKETDVAGVVRSALRSVHTQGVALPLAVDAGEEKELAAVAADSALPEAARLGAIEGLSLLATKKAETHLAALGSDASADEELRKAAWRALRRSKRRREGTKK